jgi:transcriptional regulator with XRE-family HTH domain
MYHFKRLVASIKQNLASKISLCYRLRSEELAREGLAEGGRKFMAKKSNDKGLVNTMELGRAIRRKREERGMSLRDVADKTAVSASTLSRIENGTGKPDADNIARLTAWLDVPMERIMGGRQLEGDEVQPVVFYPHESTPEIIEAHLRADRNLTPETARALSEMFRVAYQQFSHPGQDTPKRRR